MFTERTYPVGGLRLNVAEGPAHGPPLWLFHGVGRRWQDFAPLLPDLAAMWSVRACDHRGHGRSSHAPGCYFVADYVGDANALVSAGREPSVLVGHSLGALVAIGVAARSPDAVRAVVLLDPPGVGFLCQIDSTAYAIMWQRMQQLAGSHRPSTATARQLAEIELPKVPNGLPGETDRLGDLRDAAALRFMARCLNDLDPGVLTPPLQGRWLDGYDPISAARMVRCPVLLVVADPARGGMLLLADGVALTNALADCTRLDRPGVGHLLHWQDTSATLLALHAFLGSL